MSATATFFPRRLLPLALLVTLVAALWAGGLRPALAAGPESVADLAARLSPAVVNISTSQKVQGPGGVQIPELPEGSPFKEFFDEFFRQQQPQGRAPRSRNVSSLGSGFVIDESGIIITNNHVIEGADEIEAIFADGSKLKATVKGRDSKTDLAVLEVKPDKPLPAVQFGNSDTIRVGDWVMAIGNPFGLGGSVTLGIVSARNRNINAGPYDDFIQTDAAINRGNSGGPLFNMDGEVVGINTAIISPTGGSIGIGFAVPSAVAQSVIQQLTEFGETRRGWLGVRIQSVTDDLAESLKLDRPRGALVADVTATSPAEQAGVRAGDVVVSLNDKPIEASRDLSRQVGQMAPGTKVKVGVLRRGEPMEFDIELGRLEDGEKLTQASAPDTPATVTGEALGMTLATLDDALRTQHKIPAEIQAGLVVTAVDAAGAAGQKNIEVGDVITEAGDGAVTSVAELVERIEAVRKEQRGSILLLVHKAQRNFDPHFIAVKVEQ